MRHRVDEILSVCSWVCARLVVLVTVRHLACGGAVAAGVFLQPDYKMGVRTERVEGRLRALLLLQQAGVCRNDALFLLETAVATVHVVGAHTNVVKTRVGDALDGSVVEFGLLHCEHVAVWILLYGRYEAGVDCCLAGLDP